MLLKNIRNTLKAIKQAKAEAEIQRLNRVEQQIQEYRKHLPADVRRMLEAPLPTLPPGPTLPEVKSLL